MSEKIKVLILKPTVVELDGKRLRCYSPDDDKYNTIDEDLFEKLRSIYPKTITIFTVIHNRLIKEKITGINLGPEGVLVSFDEYVTIFTIVYNRIIYSNSD